MPIVTCTNPNGLLDINCGLLNVSYAEMVILYTLDASSKLVYVVINRNYRNASQYCHLNIALTLNTTVPNKYRVIFIRLLC